MPFAARMFDTHSCPLTAPTAHVGGTIIGPGVSAVQIGYRNAVTVGSDCACGPGLPNRIVKGSATVMIDRKPAARMGDSTTHGGMVTSGCETVLIG